MYIFFLATMQEKDIEIVTLCEEKLRAMIEALVSYRMKLYFLPEFFYLQYLCDILLITVYILLL